MSSGNAQNVKDLLALAMPGTMIEVSVSDLGAYIAERVVERREQVLLEAIPVKKLSGDICLTAQNIVDGDRAATHGDKLANHQNIAALWTAYLETTVTAHDVALLMALLKIARTKSGRLNIDDYVDGVGYMSIAGELSQL